MSIFHFAGCIFLVKFYISLIFSAEYHCRYGFVQTGRAGLRLDQPDDLLDGLRHETDRGGFVECE